MDLGAETITVIRESTEVDWRGDPVGVPTETDVTGCSVQPTTTTERNDQRITVTDLLTVYAPAGTDVKATDKVRWRAVVYGIDGQPAPWYDLDGSASHMEFRLKNVEG